MPRFSLRRLMLFTTLVAVLLGVVLGGGRHCLGPIIQPDIERRLHRCTTREEVAELLGNPNKVDNDGSRWLYTKWGNPGWLGVYWDEEGQVFYFDHETVFANHGQGIKALTR